MKNKIAIICNSKNPDLLQYFKCKVKALKESDLSNNFIVLKNKNINISDKNVYNSSYITSSFFDKKIPLDFIKSFYLFFIILKNRVKTVHFTTAHISNLFLSILLKPFKIKQIFTIHDLVPHPGNKSLFISLYNKVVINFLSDEIMSFSKNEIAKQPKKQKFKYFTLSGFPQYIKEPKIGDKTILFFGRMESYKGFSNLLDIINLSNENRLGYKFILAGKGQIENIEVFKQTSNVKIINRFIPDEEVKILFQKATFTILPYDSATQSGVIILSYSYATPVIAYDVGALSEYLNNGKTGFLCVYRNNDRIIEFLNSLKKDDIIKMSQNVILEFQNKYSKQACMKQYINYYKNLIEGKFE